MAVLHTRRRFYLRVGKCLEARVNRPGVNGRGSGESGVVVETPTEEFGMSRYLGSTS